MKLVILDRDGVINRDSDDYIKSPEEWEPLPGSLEAIARLNQAGFHVVVVTNQSGVGRGLFSMEALNAMHNKMHKLLVQAGGRVDAVFFCPHTPDDNCDCRKPKAGLLEQVGQRFKVRLAGVPMIGDSRRDLEAAAAVGGFPMLVLTGKGEATLAQGDLPRHTEIYKDLADAASRLIAQ